MPVSLDEFVAPAPCMIPLLDRSLDSSPLVRLRTAPAEQWILELAPLLADWIAEERRLVKQRRELSARQTRAQPQCPRRRTRKQPGKPSRLPKALFASERKLASELARVQGELEPMAGKNLEAQELMDYLRQHRRSLVTLEQCVIVEGRAHTLPAFPVGAE